MIDLQTAVLFIIIFLSQCYIGYTIYYVTYERLAAAAVFMLPLGLGLYLIQIIMLERYFKDWHVPDEDRYWLQWSYIFVFIQYIAAIVIYMDFLNY